MAYVERAELATDEYISLTPILEGFAVLKKIIISYINKKKD